MVIRDRHGAILNLGLIQRQAGVDPAVADLVVAYGRLLVDSGRPMQFDAGPFVVGSPEEVIFRALRAKNQQADVRFLAFLASYGGLLKERGRIPIFNREDLAAQLGLTKAGLSSVIARRSRLYRRIVIPKRSGAKRILHSPRAPLRPIQNWILQAVLRSFQPSEAAHGFVRGRSISTNASRHVGRRVLVGMDIADFFPSIVHRSVRKGFQQLGYPYGVTVDLANLCTLEGVLPQGAPTSPALCNLACMSLDRRLSGLASSFGCCYTRYADDLTFSSDNERLPSLIPAIRRILDDEGFRVQEDKTRITRSGQRQLVNGVVVNERPNLPRRQVRLLRAGAHRLRVEGRQAVRFRSRQPGQHNAVKVLEGHLAFLKMINPASFQSILGIKPATDTD